MMTKGKALLSAVHWLMDPLAYTQEGELEGGSSAHLLREAKEAKEYFDSEEGQEVIQEMFFGTEVLDRMLIFKGPSGKNLGLDMEMTLADLQEIGVRITLKKGVHRYGNASE